MPPKRVSVEPPLDHFQSWSQRLDRAIRAAEGREFRSEQLRPEETVTGVIKVRCYRYFRKLKRKGLEGPLAAYVMERDPGVWHRHRRDGVLWVLRLIEQRRKPILTPPTRSRIVLELGFADKCNIPSKLLLGFLHEAGSHQLLKQQATQRQPLKWTERYRAE